MDVLFVLMYTVIQRTVQNSSHQWWRDASYSSLLSGPEVPGCQTAKVYIRHNRFEQPSTQKHSMGTDCPCHLETWSKTVHAECCIQGDGVPAQFMHTDIATYTEIVSLAVAYT